MEELKYYERYNNTKMGSCGAEADNLSSACEGTGLRKAAPVGQGFPGSSWVEQLVDSLLKGLAKKYRNHNF